MIKIVGAMVIGEGEADRFLRYALKSITSVCDEVVVAGNLTDPKTEEVIKEFGCHFYADDREWGKFQPLIKERLHETIIKNFKPDWILAMDADEELDLLLARTQLEELASGREKAYNFYIVNLYGDGLHYSPELSFWKVLFYKPEPEYGYRFERKNLHCGLVPKWAGENAGYAPYLHKHYGLMRKEDRLRKAERYKKYDPYAMYKGKDYYDALEKTLPSDEFEENKVHKTVAEEVAKIKRQKIQIIMENKPKEFYVRRLRDGAIIAISEVHLDQTLKLQNGLTGQKEFELVGDLETFDTKTEELFKDEEIDNAPISQTVDLTPPAIEGFKCEKCDLVSRTKAGIAAHTRKRHA